jgi:hypothetical protein
MGLPPYTDMLISRILEVKQNAVIVIQSGMPVAMPWASKAKALLQAWYGGNETGNGIADVLFGDVNPACISTNPSDIFVKAKADKYHRLANYPSHFHSAHKTIQHSSIPSVRKAV